MARVILADVYLTTSRREWSAHTLLPYAQQAVHRAMIVADLWRDIEGGIAALSCDGEVDIGFYLEVTEDPETTVETAAWKAWLKGQLRPDHFSWHKRNRAYACNGQEVRT